MADVLEFTKYISPDGTEYLFDTKDRFLMTEEGLGLPPIEYITQKGPFQHGETLLDYRLKPRTIQLQIRQDSCSREGYWQNRFNLVDMLRPNRHVGSDFGPGVLRKIFSDGTTRDIKVIIEQGPIFSARDLSKWDEWGFTETLRFVAHDPLFFNPFQKSEMFLDFAEIAEPVDLEFPFSFPIAFGESAYNKVKSVTYLGNWMTFPKFVITGPMNGLIIYNISTGQFIELLYSISAGEVVTIVLDVGNKSVTNGSGTNLIGTIDPDSDFATFHLAPDPEVPGGVNEFYLEMAGSTSDSSIEMTYYERFVGI